MANAAILSVRGEVHREVPPEIARFTVHVAARDRDRQQTLARLAERAAAVRRLIDGYGPAIERVDTGDLRVRPELKRSGERVVAHHGTVTTTVTVSDFGVLGELMLRLADLELASVSGPWWALRPDSPTYREARRAAVDAALTRAREYAEALGARVTALLELADTGMAGHPVAMTRAVFTADQAGTAPAIDLDPQPQPVHASVEARFTLSEPTVLSAGVPSGLTSGLTPAGAPAVASVLPVGGPETGSGQGPASSIDPSAAAGGTTPQGRW